MGSPELRITPFSPEYQDDARTIILEGLGEHWGWIDEEINDDLRDIAHFYAGGHFVLGWLDSTLVATGALIREDTETMRIVRMSVRKPYRKKGIGSLVLNHLVQIARRSGAGRVVLETTATWDGAIAFYKSYGFTEEGYRNGEIYLALDLATP